MPTRADYKVTRTATLKVGVPGIGTGGQLTVPTVLSNIYGVESFNTQGQESSIDFNTFDNEGTDELINNRRWQISCSAFEINGTNPGLAIIKTALKGLGDDAVVYFEFEDQDDSGVKGFATVKGESTPREVDAPMRISWTFGVLGKIYDLSETIT
jgi:hypothetical protein